MNVTRIRIEYALWLLRNTSVIIYAKLQASLSEVSLQGDCLVSGEHVIRDEPLYCETVPGLFSENEGRYFSLDYSVDFMLVRNLLVESDIEYDVVGNGENFGRFPLKDITINRHNFAIKSNVIPVEISVCFTQKEYIRYLELVEKYKDSTQTALAGRYEMAFECGYSKGDDVIIKPSWERGTILESSNGKETDYLWHDFYVVTLNGIVLVNGKNLIKL